MKTLTAQAISAEPAGAGYAELRSSMCYIAAFDPDEVEGMSKERLEGRVRSIINVARSAVASHGQAPAGTTEPTEQQILEAAEKAGLWPNTVHSWIPAFHRYHKELAKAQPAQARTDSVLYDPKAVLDVFNSARAGSEKPVGYLRGILAVIANWESRPYPHHWMVPARADSVLEDAARYQWLRQHWFTMSSNYKGCITFRTGEPRWSDITEEALDAAIDAARNQGDSHDL